MRANSTSSLFLIGMVAMCAVLVTLPFWGPASPEDNAAEPEPTPAPSGFRYAPDRQRPRTVYESEGEDVTYSEVQLRRQLKRRSLMEHQQLRKNIVENPDMPEAVRSRFRQELDRLDGLAEQFPDLAAEEKLSNLPRQTVEDGSFTPEFAEVVQVMKQAGVWDQIHEEYVEQLEARAADESLPPEERPSWEMIEKVRSGGYIPTQ